MFLDCTPPFEVNIYADALADVPATISRGKPMCKEEGSRVGKPRTRNRCYKTN